MEVLQDFADKTEAEELRKVILMWAMKGKN